MATAVRVRESSCRIPVCYEELLDRPALDEEQAANVREIRRNHERVADVPTELVEELTEVGSKNQQIWQEAKAEDDYD